MENFVVKNEKITKNALLFNWFSLCKFLILLFLLTLTNCTSNETSSAEVIRSEASASNQNMYVIEREIPGAGRLSSADLQGISQTSCGVLDEMGSEIQWLHSYVTGDKIYCVYTAPSEEMILEHANRGGFPANSVSKVTTVIDPATAN